MGHPQLLSDRRLVRGKKRSFCALGVSIGLHGGLLVLLAGLCWLYRPHLLIIRNGSTPGAATISLETIVIVAPISTPAPPAPPVPTPVALPAKPTPNIAGSPSPQPAPPAPSHAAPTEAGVPVFAGPTTKPAPSTPAPTFKPGLAAQKIVSTSANGTGIKHLRPASDKYVSSFTPGASIFPHPPYPPEARDLQETGIVRMMIHFNASGDVVEARVSHSSGVEILDSATKSYIVEHWHSEAYAGQSVSVPVEYTLTSL